MRNKAKTYEVNELKKWPDPEIDDPTLTSCGMGSWRPKWLQVFANPVVFLINMSLVGTIQGMTGPLFISSISTLEKRYAFDSKISAVILIADNFSQMLISPFIGYLAVRYNRARLIGIAENLLDDDSPILSRYLTNRTSYEMCSSDRTPIDCTDNRGATVWFAVFVLFMGSFFRGIGFTCYFVIGFPYLDDNVSKKSSPIYMSVMQAIRLIGPASGFMLSSFCLRMYENPFYKPDFGRGDPRFVGAWWLGFCIVGTLLFIVAFPMLFFPFQFKNASVKADDIKKKMKDNGGSIEAFKRFVKNPIVMLYIAGNIFRYIGIGGYVMFKTKYIESQFRQSSSSASFITGTTSIMPMAVGILLGGAMLTVLKPKPKFILIYVFIVESLSIFGIGSGMYLGCDPININGQTMDTGTFSLSSSCAQNCDCSTRIYSPLCGSDSKTTYFSPCFAGCSSYNPLNSTFENCSCFDGAGSKGFCKQDIDSCQNLFKYLIIVLCGAIVSSTARTANSLISFRTVEPIDKGFTMGIGSSLMAIFAFIPYPIIFGSIVDSSCLVWESKCGKTGNCWVYDQTKFRNYLHGAAISFMAIGSLFDFLMIFFSNRVKNFYEDENDSTDAKLPPPLPPIYGLSKTNPIYIDTIDSDQSFDQSDTSLEKPKR
ncbi:hypothetical protein RDWZM_009557 [Blomia tropicalis]|uniref:Solute carrier organic anion transporter family member n=1 Tax=Blomia tropicalis TaxID=40697 RepID=A0A9Q0M3B2_BLOTA|nr:hypothetical protein RDWZM_009557 [Blomia tropicalis]